MRIIAGKHRSRIIEMVGISTTRETTDKVRGAIFNLINEYPMRGNCLDLFAGSGAMGLEALSRGASFCFFNDLNARATKTIKKNVLSLQYNNCSSITNLDYKIALKRISCLLDFVFLDPPYQLNCCSEVAEFLVKNNLLSHDGIIICEVGKDSDITVPEGLEIYKNREYGIRKVIIIRRKNNA